MTDIFDNLILCKKCRKEMEKVKLEKDGFFLRAVQCPICKDKFLHPTDELEYNNFKKLRDKTFRVKMRIVGNSYSVSIPKEIVNFIKEQEKVMDNMVKLCFDDSKRISLMFGDVEEKIKRNL